MLTNLTASVRFDGALNTDLSDITSNLVPFPRLHFLVPALAPLYATRDLRYRPAAGRKEPPGPARGQRRPVVAPKAQAAPRDSPAAPEQLGSSRSPPELSPRPLPLLPTVRPRAARAHVLGHVRRALAAAARRPAPLALPRVRPAPAGQLVARAAWPRRRQRLIGGAGCSKSSGRSCTTRSAACEARTLAAASGARHRLLSRLRPLHFHPQAGRCDRLGRTAQPGAAAAAGGARALEPRRHQDGAVRGAAAG